MSDPVTRQEQLLSAIATGGDIISPVTREEMYLAYMAGDTSVVLPEPITRKEQFLYQACLNGGGGGGGTEITDGIVVKARDANGYATEVDFYGSVIEYAQFYGGSPNSPAAITPFIKLQKINTKNAVTEIKGFGLSNLPELTTDGLDLSHVTTFGGMGSGTGKNAPSFDLYLPVCTTINNGGVSGSGITKFIAPEATSIANSSINGCSRLTEIKLPKITTIGMYTSTVFGRNPSLKTLEVGSVGFGVTSWGANNYAQDTQADLTITMYTTGTKVDALLADIRNGATNATIIIKASEDTTYNDVAYAAGEVMITSTVEESA